MTTDLFTRLDQGTSQILLPGFSEDGYDLTTARASLGEGEPLFGQFIVTEALAGSVGLHAELQVVALDNAPGALSSATVTFDFTGGAAEDICLWTAHGLKTGDPFRFTGGTAPTGLTAGATYYVIEVSANAFQMAATYEDALDGTEVAFTSDGSGTITGFGIHTGLSQVVTFDFTGGAAEDIVAWTAHGLTAGTPIRFTTGDSGVMPTGVTEDATYFVMRPAANHFQIATTLRRALSGVEADRVEFTTDGTAVLCASVYPTVIGRSGPIPKEILALGTIVPVRIEMPKMMGSDGNLVVPIGRYAFGRVVYGLPAPALTNVTAGMFRMDIIPGPHGNRFFGPSGFAFTTS